MVRAVCHLITGSTLFLSLTISCQVPFLSAPEAGVRYVICVLARPGQMPKSQAFEAAFQHSFCSNLDQPIFLCFLSVNLLAPSFDRSAMTDRSPYTVSLVLWTCIVLSWDPECSCIAALISSRLVSTPTPRHIMPYDNSYVGCFFMFTLGWAAFIASSFFKICALFLPSSTTMSRLPSLVFLSLSTVTPPSHRRPV